MRRLFAFYVGDTAKIFSRVVRFQYLINSFGAFGTCANKNTFFDAGYYDQAHFIKEFKKFSGVTPSKIGA